MIHGKRNGRIFGVLVLLSLMLPLFPPMNYVPVQAKKPDTPAKAVVPSRHGNNFTLSTDFITISFAGKQGGVPKFQFWYNTTDENRTVYQVFFHQLFEFNDTDGDGVFNETAGDRMVPKGMLALPSANVSLVGPEKITVDNVTIGVRFNFTILGRKGKGPPGADASGVNMTLQLSLYNETQTLVKGGSTYNVTGSAELVMDVIINGWPWKANDTRLCLWWSVNQQKATLEPSITNNSVTFGRGYFSWVSNATVYYATGNETVSVNSSFNMTDTTVNVYMSYPNFQNGTLIHDPSLGVTPPVPPIPEIPEIPGVPSDALAHNHSDVVPVGFVASVLANKTNVFLFQNLVLMTNSSKGLELNITAGSDVSMRYISLILAPNETLSLNINVTTSPPSGVIDLDNDTGVYLDIEPNATVSVDAALGLYVNETALEAELGRDINITRLTWAYWNGSNWVTVASQIDINGYLIANITHFSTWTIVEIVPLQVTAELSPDTVIQGDIVTISATVRDDAENPIEGATVTATIGDEVISLSDQGNGNYGGTIDTTDLKEGTYDVVVTAQKDGYTSIQTARTLTVKAAIPWMLYVGIAAVAAIIIVAAVLYRIKTKP